MYDYHAAGRDLYSSFILKNGDSEGISVGCYILGDSTRKLGYFTGANATGFTEWTSISASTSYTITIDNINFTTDTFSVTVKDGETPYFTGAGTFVAAPSDINSFNRLALYTIGYYDYAAPTTTISDIAINGAAVPEPSSIAFFGMGLVGFIGSWMRKGRRKI